MTATAVLTRCPAWCTEHVNDIDGSTLVHRREIGAAGASVTIVADADLTGTARQAFVCVDLEADRDDLTTEEATILAAALAEAVSLIEAAR